MKTSTWAQMARMAWQYLMRRKLRTTLTTLAIVFGVALIFAMELVLPGVEKALEQSLEAESEGVDLNIASATGDAFDPQPALDTLHNTQGVAAITEVLRRRIILPKTQQLGDITQIELIGVDVATLDQVRTYELRDGRFLENSGEAVVAPDVGKTGDTITVVTAVGLKTFAVVGVLTQGGLTPRVLIHLDEAQTALAQPGLVNLLEIDFEPGVNKDHLTDQIKTALGDDRYLYNASVSDEFAIMDIAYLIFGLFGVIALFLGAFLIFNTFRTVVIERRHDLGMLRAVGATRRQIMQLILIESLLQGVMGTLIGLILGYLMAAGMLEAMKGILDQYMGQFFDIGLLVTPGAFAVPVGLGLLCTLVAGYWPALRAGKTTPLESLRPASGATVQRAANWGLVVGFAVMALALLMLIASTKTTIPGAILFLVGAVIASPGMVMPAARLFNPLLTLWFAREGDLARGNMVRQPGRAAITASTLMIGLATFILIAAIVKGFEQLMSDLVDRSFSSDILVMPTVIGTYSSIVGADEAQVEELRQLPDVEEVAELRHAASTHNGQRLEIYGIDPQVYPDVSPMLFTKGESAQAYGQLNEGRKAILNPVAAVMLGASVGDTVKLITMQGQQPYEVVGIANDLLNLKLATVFISQESLKTDFNKTESIMMMINIESGADTQTVAGQVEDVLREYPQFTIEITSEYRSTLETMVSNNLKIYYGLGLLILIPAALGLLNTLTINVLERTREIGIVRAVGGSRVQVRRMVVAEALLLCTFGAAVGVLVGVVVSYGFISSFSLMGWEVDYVFPVMGIIAAIVIALLLALFSSILPARNAARLDIIRALQYE
ncbi:MAG: ABC transporter permease [Chloroflexi bacterium]|nr:ABC transporter permease [Chloroflexota bacterium]